MYASHARALARSLAGGLALIAFVACGDGDTPATPDGAVGEPCTPPPSPPLPATGPFTNPDELPLPAGCVVGGLRDLPGRWFVADLTALFNFRYPKYEGSCAAGFREPLGPPDDADDSDGRTRHTWTDGTRYVTRRATRFMFGDTLFERVNATALCMMPDGTLAAAFGAFDSDRGTSTSTGVGTRFAVKDEPARGLERVGGLDRWGLEPEAIVGYNVVVDAGTAYVVGPSGLDAIDVRVPAAPVHLGHIGGGDEDGFNDVRVVRGAGRVVAFASALNSDVTSVIDVTDPAQPMRLADIAEYSHSVQVRVDGARTLLYLATYTDAVPVYDVTDPTQPVRLGAPVVPNVMAGIHDLTVDGDLIYANNTTEGVVAIDVSAGLTQPAVERGRLRTSYSHAGWVATIGGRRVYLHGDEGMTPEGGAFLRILDGEPTSPTYMTELARYTSRREVGIHNIQVVGTRAYLSYYQDGIRVVDLADPTQPREVAHYNTWDETTASGAAFEGAVGVRVVDGLIYVADITQGLLILRETP